MTGGFLSPGNSELASFPFPVPVRYQKTLLLAFLFSFSLVILSQGIGQHTGLTAKDEYHLTFRTALSMVEDDIWVIPHLQGVPRIKKPPMIYWLTRMSFEVFGVSLTSARIVNAFFSALFILLVALIGFELVRDQRFGVAAALITLSSVGIAIQSKFLMLEITTTAFSCLAFYLILKWWKTSKNSLLIGVAFFLSMGFLTKGPAVFVVFGSGFMSLFATNRSFRSFARDRIWPLIGSAFVFGGCTIPWFAYVYAIFPDQSLAILQGEITGRNIGTFSLLPVSSPAILALPWTLIFITLLVRSRSFTLYSSDTDQLQSMLLVWLFLSILPFFFIKTFERYLIGSLLPISLFCAMAVERRVKEHLQGPARISMVITVIAVLLVSGVAMWFQTAIIEVIFTLLAVMIFAIMWWKEFHILRMALSSALLWMVVFGFLYPTLGINAIPQKIFDEVQGKHVILFGDQQPSLLPIEIGRSLLVTPKLTLSDFSSAKGPHSLVFAKETDAPTLEQNLKELGISYKKVGSYKTLSSRVSWLKFAREGTGRDQWSQAIQSHSLNPIKMTIVLYELTLSPD